MAAANPAKTLQDEMTCPICLEYFKDPVSLDCDHSFCKACITQCWWGFATDISCPQCREIFPERNLRPNRQLRNIVEAARELRLQTGRESGPERLCEKHKEPLKLFCKEDEIRICLVCDRSKEHRDHTVIPAEEAAEEFKEKIQAHLNTLREEREKLLGCKMSGEKRSQEYLRKTGTERRKIVSEFQQLRQFLEEQERLLWAQLEKLEKEVMRIRRESVTKLSEEISRLSELISEMEGMCQKPVSEFLQDVRSTLSRCEKGKFQQPVEISPKQDKRLSDFLPENSCFNGDAEKVQRHSAVCTGNKKRGTCTSTQTGYLILSDPYSSVTGINNMSASEHITVCLPVNSNSTRRLPKKGMIFPGKEDVKVKIVSLPEDVTS
ncbi:unnamed protein product [Caretta caretta]